MTQDDRRAIVAALRARGGDTAPPRRPTAEELAEVDRVVAAGREVRDRQARRLRAVGLVQALVDGRTVLACGTCGRALHATAPERVAGVSLRFLAAEHRGRCRGDRRPRPSDDFDALLAERDGRRETARVTLRRNGFRYESGQVVCLLCEMTVLESPGLEMHLSLPFSVSALRLGHHRIDGCRCDPTEAP